MQLYRSPQHPANIHVVLVTAQKTRKTITQSLYLIKYGIPRQSSSCCKSEKSHGAVESAGKRRASAAEPDAVRRGQSSIKIITNSAILDLVD